MSDGKLFVKCRASELRAEIETGSKKTKPHNQVKVILKKVIANIIFNNHEVLHIFSTVTSLMRIDDFEIRKMCLQYVENSASFCPKEANIALPFIERFESDTNPALRIAAIRTVASTPLKSYFELALVIIRRHLVDNNPQVRITAAYAVTRLYQYNAGRVTEANVVEDLNQLLLDSDEGVVANTLEALSCISENGEGLSLAINREHAMRLLSYLNKVNEWCQIYILHSLMSYVPQTTKDALYMIELVIPCLRHENSAVVMNAVKVIVYSSNYVRNVKLVLPSLQKRLSSSLVNLLCKPAEMQFLVLRNIILLLLSKKQLVKFDVEVFFCEYEDPVYVKDTKLEIIYLIANESNIPIVLRELEEYAMEIDVLMARKAIRAFGNLALKLEKSSQQCVDVIDNLVSHGVPYIVQEATGVTKNILRKYPGKYEYMIQNLLTHYKVIDEPSSKSSFIWILGQYGESKSNIQPVVEYFIANFREETIEVQSSILTAVTKLYLLQPDLFEYVVIRVFKCATEDIDRPDIRDRAFIYWRILTSEELKSNNSIFQEDAKNIVLGSFPVINTDGDAVADNILEELELNVGTLASIYLKLVRNVFRYAKSREVPFSPAMQEKSLPTPPLSANSFDSHANASNIINTRQHSYASQGELTNERPLQSTFSRRSSRSSEHSLSEPEDNKISNLARRLTRKASIITGIKK